MIKSIFLILFLQSILFGCSICTIYSPQTKVSINIKANDKKIQTASVTWILTKEFSEQLKQIYDKNQNNYLDKKELEPIQQSILDYVVRKNYLTHISYGKIINKDITKEIVVKKHKTYIKHSLLHFTYELKLDYDVISDNILYLNFNDEESYFVLLLAKNGIKLNAPFKFSKVEKRKSVAFYINPFVQNDFKNDFKNDIEKEEKPLEITRSANIKKEETLVSEFSKKVKEYLVKIDKGDNWALFILLGISFLYGIVHALGPGHGKSLAFSYFVSNKSSYLKAFIISQLSAFIHIIGALILVVISVFVLQSVLNNFVNDSVEILTKISAVLIILLASYILYNKLKNKSCSCSSCKINSNVTNWSTSKPVKQNSLKPNFKKQDLYFVLTAGLIPCPGTVVLFIYAFILKTYFAVLLASIFISLGMGLVIFASSFLGVSLNKVSQKSHNIANILEILAPIVMFVLGILLFLNANLI
jgi:ABC-type nickel/cobalt efflux system permease component RcnA/ABC-type uncharacterized transport system substrate-binding protein